MNSINVGFIGLGGRGVCLLKDVVLSMEKVSVVSVCDAYEDRARAGAEIVLKATGVAPACESGVSVFLCTRQSGESGYIKEKGIPNGMPFLCSHVKRPKPN